MNSGQTKVRNLNTHPSAPILVFDIETLPDIPLLLSNYEPELDFEVADSEVWRDLRILDVLKKQHENFFPAPLFHCVISICALFVDPETHKLKDGFRKSVPTPSSYEELRESERELLKEFWDFSLKYKDHAGMWLDQEQGDFPQAKYSPRKFKPIPVTFCGYNICGFDLPVIEQRSLRNFLTCPIPEYAQEMGVASYRYKFAMDKCFDLCAYISNHSPRSRTGLDVLARSMGLGGKMAGMDGSRVAEVYFQKGGWEQIEEYCAIDVLITYGVFLSVQKFRGVLDEQHFCECLLNFKKFLMLEGKPSTYRELAQNSEEFFAFATRRKP